MDRGAEVCGPLREAIVGRGATSAKGLWQACAQSTERASVAIGKASGELAMSGGVDSGGGGPAG